jgi:hypothetical protein
MLSIKSGLNVAQSPLEAPERIFLGMMIPTLFKLHV